jgi:glycosyltransferase involved in cell wall biosynthesis
VNVVTLALPGDPDTLTGGYLYARRLSRALRRSGLQVDPLRLDERFPFPDERALGHAATALAALPDGAAVLLDGLALGAMPAVVAAERERLRVVALVHHPLALETGLDIEVAATLERSEREALAAVHHVIATSPWTGGMLQSRYAVSAERLTVAEPGIDPAPPARGSGGPGLCLLCVATLIPRKGHDLLLDALAPLSRRTDWQLLCIGSTDRDPQHARRLDQRVRRHGLQGRVHFAGEVNPAALQRHFHEADAFVLETHLEGCG